MKRFITAVVVTTTLALGSAALGQQVVFDTYNGATSLEQPTPYSARILDFITIDGDSDQWLDGLRYGFTISGLATGQEVPLVIYTQFHRNVNPNAANPLEGSTSLGTKGLNWGNRAANGGFLGGIGSGMYSDDGDDSNDVLLPAGEVIGVEFRFREDPSTYSTNVTGRLGVPAASALGTWSDFYYLDTGLNGFSAADLVNKPAGKTLRLELIGLAVPEPTMGLSLAGISLLGLRRRR